MGGIEPDALTGLSRRDLLARISAVGAAALGLPELAAPERAAAAALPSGAADAVRRASSVAAAGSDLGAIDHIVFLMMENRSYDHMFGAYHRGRGFDDHPKHSLRAFAQPYPAGTNLSPKRKLLPFHLDPRAGEDCTKDLTHDWGPQHECWNHGKMNAFVTTHTRSDNEGNPDGAMTMGYYTRRDLPFYWSLADHFTLGDHYFSSILGPTHPNRVMSLTGTIDPSGRHGGPVTDTNPDPSARWTCTWPTVQELLQDKGVSWKVYHPDSRSLVAKGYPTWEASIYDPTANPFVMLASDHVLPYFKAFKSPASVLHAKAFRPTFPHDFQTDVRSGHLPSVSWIIPPLGFDDHPSTSPERGMWFVQQVLNSLTANKKVWARTALFVMYDENDGWFDHVPPPVPPRGAAGEFLTAKKISSTTDGIRGPLGLGVRVPILAISPFSRGGHVASRVYDHTSQLRLLEERFGIHVSTITPWRRKTVGDLTSALFRGSRDMSMPALPTVKLAAPQASGSCAETSQDDELGGTGPKIPTKQRMPTQHGTTVPGSHYFPKSAGQQPASESTLATSSRSTATTKSAYNALADPDRGADRMPATAVAVVAALATAQRLRRSLAETAETAANAANEPAE